MMHLCQGVQCTMLGCVIFRTNDINSVTLCISSHMKWESMLLGDMYCISVCKDTLSIFGVWLPCTACHNEVSFSFRLHL